MNRERAWAALCGLALGAALPARGAPPPDDPGLDPAEQAALAAALQADAATVEDAVHPAPVVVAAGAGSSNPDISLVLDTAGAWFSDAPAQLGGHDPNRTGFVLQQLEMNVVSNVDPFFRFEANIVFAEFGVEVEEAYATSLALPGNLQLRAGQFLTRFGRLNPTHPHAWDFVDQPLVNGKFFGSEGSRGLGAEVSWLSPLPWYAELAGALTNAHNACCARSFYGGDDLGVEDPRDLLATLTLKQFFDLSRTWGLKVGLSTQLGPNPTGQGNRTDIYGADLYLRYRDPGSRGALSLQVEGMVRSRQAPDDRLQDAGGYAQLVWDIDPEWGVGARYEYVSGVEDDPLDPAWATARQRASAQVTWWPSHFSRLRLQGNHDRLPDRDDPLWGAMLALEVVVGAHGAHGY